MAYHDLNAGLYAYGTSSLPAETLPQPENTIYILINGSHCEHTNSIALLHPGPPCQSKEFWCECFKENFALQDHIAKSEVTP